MTISHTEHQSALDKAKRLEDKPIRTLREGVCSRCGASDAAHNSAFKQMHAFTPGTYTPEHHELEHWHYLMSHWDAINENGTPATVASFKGEKGACTLCVKDVKEVECTETRTDTLAV